VDGREWTVIALCVVGRSFVCSSLVDDQLFQFCRQLFTARHRLTPGAIITRRSVRPPLPHIPAHATDSRWSMYGLDWPTFDWSIHETGTRPCSQTGPSTARLYRS